jgi:hypothetical protein
MLKDQSRLDLRLCKSAMFKSGIFPCEWHKKLQAPTENNCGTLPSPGSLPWTEA